MNHTRFAVVLVPCLPESGTPEAKNALARAVFLNRLGEIRDQSFENQRYRASGLNLWNTVYLQRAVDYLRKQGIEPGPTDFAHLSPLGWAYITLTGDYYWEVELSMGPDPFRPLRTTDFAMTA